MTESPCKAAREMNQNFFVQVTAKLCFLIYGPIEFCRPASSLQQQSVSLECECQAEEHEKEMTAEIFVLPSDCVS
jgi:hypothetical protein